MREASGATVWLWSAGERDWRNEEEEVVAARVNEG
jgi:hypothetical protein